MSDVRDFLKGSSPEIWTKEARRIEQITLLEDKINLYKETEQWALLLNSLEDYLRFQMEAMEEKGEKDETTGKKTPSRQGMFTETFTTQYEEIQELLEIWNLVQKKSMDPVMRRRDEEDKRFLIRRIKNLINLVYHNNVKFGLTYKRRDDVFKAAYQ